MAKSHIVPLSETSSRPSDVRKTPRILPLGLIIVLSKPPVAEFHNLTVPSWLPETSVRPSGLKKTELPQGTSAVHIKRPVKGSHNFTAPSSPPETSVRPSGLKETDQTARAWPFSVRSSRPPATCQSFTVPSSLPEAMRRPSRLNEMERTAPVGPVSTTNSGFCACVGRTTTTRNKMKIQSI